MIVLHRVIIFSSFFKCRHLNAFCRATGSTSRVSHTQRPTNKQLRLGLKRTAACNLPVCSARYSGCGAAGGAAVWWIPGIRQLRSDGRGGSGHFMSTTMMQSEGLCNFPFQSLTKLPTQETEERDLWTQRTKRCVVVALASLYFSCIYVFSTHRDA